MKRTWQRSLAAALVLTAVAVGAPGNAFAGHPLGTEDAETIGMGNVEVELNYERLEDVGASRETSVGNTYTFGILPRLDMAASFAYLFSKPDGRTPTDRGFGDTEATLKTSFSDGEAWIPALAVKAGVRLPTGDENKGLGDGRTSALFTLIADWKIEPVTIHANVGNESALSWTEGRARDTTMKASLAVEWEARERVTVVSEYLWEKDSGTEKPAAALLIGGKTEIADNIVFDLGIRWGTTTASPIVTYLAGFTFAFHGAGAAGQSGNGDPSDRVRP